MNVISYFSLWGHVHQILPTPHAWQMLSFISACEDMYTRYCQTLTPDKCYLLFQPVRTCTPDTAKPSRLTNVISYFSLWGHVHQILPNPHAWQMLSFISACEDMYTRYCQTLTPDKCYLAYNRKLCCDTCATYNQLYSASTEGKSAWHKSANGRDISNWAIIGVKRIIIIPPRNDTINIHYRLFGDVIR